MWQERHNPGSLDLPGQMPMHLCLQFALASGHNLPAFTDKLIEKLQVSEVCGRQHLLVTTYNASCFDFSPGCVSNRRVRCQQILSNTQKNISQRRTACSNVTVYNLARLCPKKCLAENRQCDTKHLCTSCCRLCRLDVNELACCMPQMGALAGRMCTL